LKKLKLAIFGVQAKSIRQQLFSSSKKSNHGGADRRSNHRKHQLSQPLIQSWRQKVVEGHLSLLDELIKFPEAKCTHHQLANNHADQLALPGRYPTAAFNSIHPRTLPLDFLLREAGSAANDCSRWLNGELHDSW
jgi:hypothetical protein